MQLRAVLSVIRRNWLIIVAALVVGVAAAGTLATLLPKSYETETQVLVTSDVPVGTEAGATVAQASALATDQVETYAALAMTSAVLDPAIDSSGVDVASTDLVDDVTSEVVPQTSIVMITVSAGSAQDAVELGNAISASLIDQIEAGAPASGAVQLSGRVVQEPVVPTSPASPFLILDLALGLAVGLAVAFIVVVARQAMAAPAPALARS
jgi:succinoglycan biosynthesis transport protein ExoP